MTNATDEWPPLEFELPNMDTVEAISRAGLLPEPPTEPRDMSREARIQRLLALLAS